MFHEEFEALCEGAVGKVSFLKKNSLGYVLASMLAGAYVGLGILLIFSIGGQLEGAVYTKMAMGASFGIALSLVVIAGAELFTGNNLVMTGGLLAQKVTLKQTVTLWIVCFLGNWLGAIVIALLFVYSGLATGAVGAFITKTAIAKTTAAPMALVCRGILCNVLVCLAVWSGFRCKSDSGKLIMIFWCLFAFITSGYEHSVANMTLLSVAFVAPVDGALTAGAYLFNLGLVTVGNMIGGILFLTVPYYIISKKKEV